MGRIIFFLLVANAQLFAQCDRWQQAIRYRMDVDFDASVHRFDTRQEVTYFNRSPDTLRTVYFHLYFNAFQPGSSMDLRSRNLPDPDAKIADRIAGLKPQEQGYHDIRSIRQSRDSCRYEVWGTILKVDLAKPLYPGDSTVLDMSYRSQVPLQIRRSGRFSKEGIHYSMAQWYVKMCQYDEMGWHTNPYIAREFYGIWGDFDVTIRIDSSYTIGATGILQSPATIGKGYARSRGRNKDNRLTWRFVAENVHDFVWGADPEYRHVHVRTPDDITLRFFYRDNEHTAESWSKLPEAMIEAFDYIQSRFGKYPYKEYAFIQGGDGGMEYPMATLITGHRPLNSLVGVSVHEVMHSWYQGVLASNEALYAWLDEGFTNYASEQVMQHLQDRGFIKAGISDSTLYKGAYRGYINIATSGLEESLITHADHFNYNATYGIAAYTKGSLYLLQLGYIIGRDNLDKTLLAYYDACAFRHPNANDFRRVAEKVSGIELKWYHEYWINSTSTIDYKLSDVSALDTDRTRVDLQRIGRMPMPVDLLVTLRDGRRLLWHIPLDLMLAAKPDPGGYDAYQVAPYWAWVNPMYTLELPVPHTDILSVRIDPAGQMMETDRTNNSWPVTEP